MPNRTWPGLVRLVALCLAVLVASGCQSSQSAPPKVTFVNDCASIPDGLLEQFIWSSDGSHLAIVSGIYLAEGTRDQISVIDWQTLDRTILYRGPVKYSGIASLQVMTIDPSGSTAYFWTNLDGSHGIWSVASGEEPKLLTRTDSNPTGPLQWSPDGIFRVSWDPNTGVDTISLTSWAGSARVVRTEQDGFSAWVGSDGWTIEKLGSSHAYHVVHGNVDVTVEPSVEGELLGMTQDRSAIVYRPLDQTGADGALRLTLLPIDGGRETQVEVPITIGRAAGFFSLSDSGVLAYTDDKSETSELCTSRLPQ